MTDISVEDIYKQFCLDMLDAIEKWERGEDTPEWFCSKVGLCSNLENCFEINNYSFIRFQRQLFNWDSFPFNNHREEYRSEQDTDTIYSNEARLTWLRKYAGKEI